MVPPPQGLACTQAGVGGGQMCPHVPTSLKLLHPPQAWLLPDAFGDPTKGILGAGKGPKTWDKEGGNFPSRVYSWPQGDRKSVV